MLNMYAVAQPRFETNVAAGPDDTIVTNDHSVSYLGEIPDGRPFPDVSRFPDKGRLMNDGILRVMFQQRISPFRRD